MKRLILITLFSIPSIFHSQNKDIAGIYGEGLIGKFNPQANYIELKSDSTFVLTNFGKKYQGDWSLSGNKILLNPKTKREFAKVNMKESKITSDSVTIKINYIPESNPSENQEFRIATIYFDKKRNYVNLLKSPYIKQCFWAPSIKNQHILKADNSIVISQKEFSQIGFMTYNLEDYIVFQKKNKDSNFFEFEIEDVLTNENILKEKYFILDGKFLHYPNKKGKPDIMRVPLIKKKME
ncbi:hypothetical protein [Chryseobacterium sp. Marseille-Q3244]|uniref:hypothetical protein n=1 Tax=Chryseobacterium sp. Marseille-Q3244 TaxID=2758092 RepID=UPI0020257B79|nr:hypothetical protein [Chryseobacterium sp. Marseille-Q3244]